MTARRRDMLEGVNAVTYGQVIPSAPHASVVSDTCAGCHMQVDALTNANAAFAKAGGHTFKMSYTNSLGAKVPVAYVCTQCHGAVTNFDIPAPDYVGYGYSQGIQTQVQILLNQLSMLLPPATYQANPANYVADGLVKSASTFRTVPTNWPAKFLKAVYNFEFVANDASQGVHNGPFAVGLLKASIANLTGISTTGGLPDAWEIQYFGNNFATNPAASPDAVNNSAGVPNWMMYALGLDSERRLYGWRQRRDLFQRRQHRQWCHQHRGHLQGGGNRLQHADGHHLYDSGHLRPHRQLAKHQHQHSRHRRVHQLPDPDAEQRANVLSRGAYSIIG